MVKAKDKVKAAPTAEGGTILSMDEAIRMLKTTRPSFNRWLRAGKFTGMKVGRQWRFYKEEVERFMRGENPRQDNYSQVEPLNKLLGEKLAQLGWVEEPITGRPEYFNSSVRAADLLILLGRTLGASDIHIEPGAGKSRLRFRVDGMFQPPLEFDTRWLPFIVHQLKDYSGCNNNEIARPQDGKIKFEYQGRPVELRVSFMLAAAGESAVLSFVESGWAASMTLENSLQINPAAKDRLLRLVSAPYGLFLTVGPTGSGKTVTLYAILNHLNTPEKKLVSIEDSVQAVPGVLQLQVKPDQGMGFGQMMRHALRADPNIIMLTDIPDAESMEMVIKAALTGHMVLSSLHAEDSAATLKRMVDIGIDPSYVGDATAGILSQRLLRKVCDECAVKAAPSAAELESAKKVCAAGGLDFGSLPSDYRKAVGCAKCNHTGYRRRCIVAEVLEVSPEIRSALKHGASVEQLRAIAVQQGMTSQAAEAIRAAAEGKTSLQEAMRLVH